MTYKHKSADGLMQSNDGAAVAAWDRIGREMAEAQRVASDALIARGVKLEHPDDGWVNREANYVSPCYPRFNLSPDVGDLIALGWPRDGYRLVRVTRVEEWGIIARQKRYHFEDTGERVTQ